LLRLLAKEHRMADWFRIVLALAVGAHGVGHILFLGSLLGVADWGQASNSWLLGSGWLARGLGTLIWLLAGVGFVSAAFGIFRESDWWPALAVFSAVVSAVGLLLFWARPASSPAISAMVFNVLLLGALIVFHWPQAVRA
jgi:hypothetical protein